MNGRERSLPTPTWTFVFVARIRGYGIYVVKRANLMPNKDADFLRFNKAAV